ncbi:MAG: adenylate/guanylate cyclase domain-containing protein, partial [Caldimonas sp.]
TDPQVRVQFLQEGERLLALGCVSHNHIQLRELAIDALLEIGDWDAVELNCERIRAYTAAEPLPMSEFLITRGRVLARFGRGERGADVRAALVELRELATRAEWHSALPAIESALAGDARFETVSGSR